MVVVVVVVEHEHTSRSTRERAQCSMVLVGEAYCLRPYGQCANEFDIANIICLTEMKVLG